MTILQKLLSSKGIVSDGDWDGVFGTGILVRWATEREINVKKIIFPSPLEIKKGSYSRIVSLEIVPTKCKIEKSIIFDHHEGPHTDIYEGNIWIYGKFLSVGRLIVEFLDMEVPKVWIDAIDEVDSGFPTSKLGTHLFKAYQANVESFPRREIAELISREEYDQVLDLLSERVQKYNKQEQVAEVLIKSAEELIPRVVYFTYEETQQGARRIAMFKLEQQYDIVIAIRIQNETLFSSIATMKENIDLTKLFNELRKIGLSSGGHSNVGGVSGDIPQNKFLEILKNLIYKLYYSENK